MKTEADFILSEKAVLQMINDPEDILNDIYNLILNPATRDWERKQLLTGKKAAETGRPLKGALSDLEYQLRPLAARNNLTADLSDFYLKLTNNASSEAKFDLSRHYEKDPDYVDRAIFAGGCFWCMVEPFENKPGILLVLSGYTGGHTQNPSYEEVLQGGTGHVEAVEIIFDTRIVHYEDLVALYWQLTDPTDALGQFADRGDNYRPVIFVRDAKQRQIAQASKTALAKSGLYDQPIVTAIEPAGTFWPAENFHQQFYKKNPRRYKQLERSRHTYQAYQHLRAKIHLFFRRLSRRANS
ncbi:peptide-methionine (S)-S-oxide reductase MsrA [Oenococcus sp.]|uniref:peptide-methionine (S)-S-oxide reductase MsrA n=2 Tax=Lactobacillaceae TaxID=33958 RepID=UPI0039E9A488